MSDSDLAKYIPKFGDRIATVAFCRQSYTASGSTASSSRSDHMLTRLRQRLSTATPLASPIRNPTWVGNQNAARKERRVELGWMDFDFNKKQYKQVKAINGGGTRHVSFDKNTTVGEILSIAQDTFFPDGESKNKKLTSYDTEIQSSQMEVSSPNTIEELYSRSRVRILRLYLCTKLRDEEVSETEKEATPQTSPNSPSEHVAEMSPLTFPNAFTIDIPTTTDSTVLWEGELTLTSNEASPVTLSVVLPNTVNSSPSAQPVCDPEPSPIAHPGHTPTSLAEVSVTEEIVVTSAQTPLLDLTTASPEHTFSGQDSSLELDTDSDHVSRVTLIIRRGHCFRDLIKAFKDPKLLGSEIYIKMRLPNGHLEEGEGIGVLRDCITEFWMEFYEIFTMGHDAKVPFIRHDFQIDEWQAVARVLVLGWKCARYFPVQLAAPFLEEALYGTASSSCKDAFLQYVSDQEKQVLLSAIEDFDSVDKDAVIDLLDVHECHHIPYKENLLPLLSQLGHKSIIQSPMYIIECWRPILHTLAHTLPIEGLHQLLQEKNPTSKTVKDLLQFPEEMSAAQHAVARYLKRYITEADHQTLQNFLRFCTGSNLVGSRIEIEFIDSTDFQRRPQAHTCACILKLPIGYYNYPDLRNDFNSVLTSSVWVMDII